MSRTADIADAATAVQQMLTEAEKRISGQLPLDAQLPDWYINLRNQIHGLVTSAAWAVGSPGGADIVGTRCEGRTHTDECIAYRAAGFGWDLPELAVCPKCKAEVHALFDAGPEPFNCYPCWGERKCGKCNQSSVKLVQVGPYTVCEPCAAKI